MATSRRIIKKIPRKFKKQEGGLVEYGAGGVISGAGGVLGAIPTPWTQIAGAGLSLIGSIVGGNEQKKAEEEARVKQVDSNVLSANQNLLGNKGGIPTMAMGGEVGDPEKPGYIFDPLTKKYYKETTIGNVSNDSMPYTDKELRNAKTQRNLADIATGVATWGTQFRKPNQKELNAGRKGGIDRITMLAKNQTAGLVNEMLGAGMGKIAQKIVDKGIKYSRNSKELYNRISKEAERPLTNDEFAMLQEELDRRGVLKIQETRDLPGKDYINNTLMPYSYDIPGHIKGLIPGTERNKLVKTLQNDTRYQLEQLHASGGSTKPADMGAANRVDTWDMYLGKPQMRGDNQLYNISPYSTNKKIAYTHNPSRIVDKSSSANMINSVLDGDIKNRVGKPSIEVSSRKTKPDLPGSEYRVADTDTYLYGTMGGFGYDVQKVAGKNKAIATDVWDLQPFASGENLPSFLKKVALDKDGNKVIKPNVIGKKIKDLEVGSSLGIGKPFKVIDEFDKKIYQSPKKNLPSEETKMDIMEKMKLEDPNLSFVNVPKMPKKKKYDIFNVLRGPSYNVNAFTPSLNSYLNAQTVTQQRQIYAMGGMIPGMMPNVEVEGGEVIQGVDDSLAKVVGPKHSQGGVQLMMENGGRVFSDKIINPKTGRTYAEDAERYMKMMK
jgi:hypothetical protein